MGNHQLSIMSDGAWNAPSENTHRPYHVCTLESIDVVFFDLCGVLYDESYWRRWLLQLVSRMGLHTHYTLFYRAWESEYEEDVYRGHISYWDALVMFLRSAGLTRAQIDEVTAAGEARLRAFEDQIRPFPTVRSTLSRLAAQDIELWILCSQPIGSEVLLAKLERLQLAKWFSGVLADGSFCGADERSAHLREQLDALEISAANAVYVGRRREHLASAARAGLFTVAFNEDPDADANVHLGQFDRLVDAVQSRRPTMLAAG